MTAKIIALLEASCFPWAQPWNSAAAVPGLPRNAVSGRPYSGVNAPSHRVFVAKAEIGACRQKTSKEGRDYLSIKLDDPSFTAPIFASLFADDDGKTFNLIWSRARTSNSN